MSTFDYEESETRYQTAIEMQEMALFSLLKPSLTTDGNMWCVMYVGESPKDSIIGFGKSPGLAVQAWNKEWYKELEDVVAKEIFPCTNDALDKIKT